MQKLYLGVDGGQTSTVDLKLLKKANLRRLENFLNRRHAGLTTPYEMVRHLAWLLELSLQQSQPQLSRAERQREVRQLLLVPLEDAPGMQSTASAEGLLPKIR